MVVSSSQWQRYKNIINKVHDDFNQKIAIWHRFTRRLPRYGEDSMGSASYTDIELKVLISFNAYRVWPLTKETPAGLIDQESLIMILNIEYLRENGYLNEAGFFNMDPGMDRFTISGVKYKPTGETEVSQAGDEALLFYMVLARDKVETGQDRF